MKAGLVFSFFLHFLSAAPVSSATAEQSFSTLPVSTPNKNVAVEHSRPGEAVQFGVNANRTENTFGD